MSKFMWCLAVWLGLCGVGLFAGGAGEAGGGRAAAAPDWVRQAPADGGGVSYFVASGNDSGGDEARAADAAALDLVNQINRYLGVSISAESLATEVASADQYLTTVRGMVRQEASGQIAGLRVAGRHLAKGKNGATVWLLGEYKTADLEQEKAKRAALAREAEDAVALPEAKGAAAEAAGQPYEALRRYLEAATAAAGGRVRNADVKFEREVQAALRVLSRLQLAKRSGPGSAVARQAYAQDFSVALVDAISGQPQAGADLALSYRESAEAGKTRLRTVALKTDAAGLARGAPSAPGTVGAEKVAFSLDLSAYLQGLDGVAGRQRQLLDGLRDALGAKRAVFDVSVQAAGRGASVAALVLERDEAGRRLEGDRCALGIRQALSGAGFKPASLAVGSNFLLDKSDEEIRALAKDLAGGRAERVVYGSAAVQSLDDRGGDGVFAKAAADLTVLEVKTGAVLLSFRQTANARGDDRAAAVAAVLAKLGQDCGERLARELP